jgi:hypothetical protein
MIKSRLGHVRAPCRSTLLFAACGLIPWCATGCGTLEGNVAIGALAGTGVLAQAPGHEIEQVYYLGVFDPQDQLPSQVYRVTVRGQASSMSGMKFGSGWVPAGVIDALGTSGRFAEGSDRATFDGDPKEPLVTLKTGRRLMMFGPEGFREAPKDYRLAIVMGASPEKFFQAIDSSLGLIAQVRNAQRDPEVSGKLAAERDRLRSEQRELTNLLEDVNREMPEKA